MKKKRSAKTKPQALFEAFPSFEEHEKQQFLYVYQHSTPLKRLTWLEQAILLFSQKKK